MSTRRKETEHEDAPIIVVVDRPGRTQRTKAPGAGRVIGGTYVVFSAGRTASKVMRRLKSKDDTSSLNSIESIPDPVSDLDTGKLLDMVDRFVADVTRAIGEAETSTVTDEDAIDLDVARAAQARIDAGERLIPGEVVHRIFAGENPIRVWREYRGLTQKELGEKAAVGQSYLSQIERGLREGKLSTMRQLAVAFDTTIDDLVPPID